ncbi:plasmid recombination protein [Sulfitobacter sp.]|jgi:hypothetical protein|uniref:plasmid recombination protein n=1 Tax=Sulfitobacter sp. TaxID=1903071 RepID=UPI0039E712B8
MASKKHPKHPIVLRFEGIDPGDIGGYEAHRYRKGGDLGHIDREKPKPRLLIGTETWADEARAEIKLMKLETFAAELADLDRRKRRKEIEKRRIEGPRDPWRASRHGPMRELILTANKEWFEQTESSDVEFSTSKEELFEKRAVDWLKEHFGNDVIHARADLDEQAYHIHAVIMPRANVQKYGTECRLLQPSIHPLIKDYEAAQDSVGEWFSEIGLARGQRHKQAIRDALNDGRKPPANPRHVRPAAWRAKQERKLAEKEATLEARQREVVEREEQAEEIIAFGEAVATGGIDENGQPTTPAQQTDKTASPTPARNSSLGFTIARKAYRMAMKRLRGKATEEAERKARVKVAKEVAEIKAADDVIVEIGKQLPEGMRARIAKVRRKLTARIMRLDPNMKGRFEGPVSGGDDTR